MEAKKTNKFSLPSLSFNQVKVWLIYFILLEPILNKGNMDMIWISLQNVTTNENGKYKVEISFYSLICLNVFVVLMSIH